MTVKHFLANYFILFLGKWICAVCFTLDFTTHFTSFDSAIDTHQRSCTLQATGTLSGVFILVSCTAHATHSHSLTFTISYQTHFSSPSDTAYKEQCMNPNINKLSRLSTSASFASRAIYLTKTMIITDNNNSDSKKKKEIKTQSRN